MSSMAKALDRLEQSLARLERAVESHQGLVGAEREKLQGELRELRTNHATLQSEARSAYARLDQIIGRLRAVAEA
jgi:hypothetical protein